MEESLDEKSLGTQRGLMLTWKQVKAFEKGRPRYRGAYAFRILILPTSANRKRDRRVSAAKKKIEQEIGEPIEHFSYPHPALNPRYPQTFGDHARSRIREPC